MKSDKTIHPDNSGRGGKLIKIKKSDIEKLRAELAEKKRSENAGKSAAPKDSPDEDPSEDKGEGIAPLLEQNSTEISVPLSGEAIRAFKEYAALLRKWNKVMNLTNIVDDNGIAMRHFIDSLTLVPFLEEEQKRLGRKDLSLIDVGTGAGFPGIPVKVRMSEIELTLLDSLNKRINFLNEVVDKLELKNVVTLHSRAEDAGSDKKYRGRYDVATARAVASLPVLCEYCLPFVKTGGAFIAMKGHVEEELEESTKAIIKLGGSVETVKKFVLPGTDMDRSVVVIRKIRPTPPGYPRQAGKPGKDPIR